MVQRSRWKYYNGVVGNGTTEPLKMVHAKISNGRSLEKLPKTIQNFIPTAVGNGTCTISNGSVVPFPTAPLYHFQYGLAVEKVRVEMVHRKSWKWYKTIQWGVFLVVAYFSGGA